MLVLSRKIGEQIVLGENIHVTVLAVSGNRVCLGIQAPPDIAVRRAERRPLAEVDSSARSSHSALVK